MSNTNTKRLALLKLSVGGYEGKILTGILQASILPELICVKWEGFLNGAYDEQTLEGYLRDLHLNNYQLIFDDGNQKHTYLLCKN